jgi:peptidoglycan/LPS O-acetylase OafA/YrhL
VHASPGGVISTAARADHSARVVELDVLRGLAALSVLLFHYLTRFGELHRDAQHPAIGWSLGSYGMQFFFMISGFVICMTLERTRRSLDFVVSRFSRLYPVYWASIIVTTAVVWTFGLPGLEVPLRDTIANLTMVQTMLGFQSVDGVYWSLLVELKFYIVMLVIFACGLLPTLRWLVLAWIPLAFAVNHAYAFTSYGHTLPIKALHGLMISDWMHLFAIGIVMYQRKKTGRFHWVDCAIIGLCLINEYQHRLIHMYDRIPGAPDEPPIGPAGSMLLVGALSVVLYALAAGRLRWLNARPLLFLGAISYPLYLVHQHVGFVVLREFGQLGWDVHWGILVATIVAIVLASILHSLVEMPAMNAIRSRYKAWNRAGRPAPLLGSEGVGVGGA